MRQLRSIESAGQAIQCSLWSRGDRERGRVGEGWGEGEKRDGRSSFCNVFVKSTFLSSSLEGKGRVSYRSTLRFRSSSILTVTGNSSVVLRILLSRIQDEMHTKAGQRNAKAKSMLSFLHDATGESGCSQTSSNRRRFRLTEASARMSFVHPPPRSATSTFSISSLSLGQIPELDCTVLSLLCNAHGETNAFKCNSAFQVRRIQVLQRQQRGGMNHQIHQGLEDVGI